MKKMLRLEEIEAQVTLELPERDLMTTGVLQGLAGAVAGNIGAMTSDKSILNTALSTDWHFNDHFDIKTAGSILNLSGNPVTT
jgi:hypothetical protein